MKLEEHVREAIVGELKRQSEAGGQRLVVKAEDPATIVIEGPVNLDELALAVVGAIAGGP